MENPHYLEENCSLPFLYVFPPVSKGNASAKQQISVEITLHEFIYI